MDPATAVRSVPVQELRLDPVLQRLHDAVVLVSWPDRHILDVNQALLRLFRCAPSDVVGKPTRSIHVDDARWSVFAQRMQEALPRGESLAFDFELRRPDGSVFPANIAVSGVGEGYPPSALVGVVRDLTEAVRQEKARAEAEARWRSVVEYAHDWIYLADEQGRIQFINRGRGERTPDDIVGGTLYDWLSPEDAARVRPIYEGVFRDGRAATFATTAVIEGAREHYECRVSPVLQDGIVVAASVTTIDITQRVQTEEELRRTARNLNDFVETSAIGLHWVAEDGTILWANPADYRLLGYEREEFIGQNIRRFHADPEVIADILARLARDEKLYDYPARLRAKDGSIRHVLIDSSVLWEDGRFAHTRCFTRDVTLQRALEQRERENARMLKTLVRVQEDLARTLELESVVQTATDAATVLTGAQFGAFFYNVTDARGERYTLYTLSGAAREGLSLPRTVPTFAPAFDGARVVRSDDVTQDPLFRDASPFQGLTGARFAVRSYLAAPVASRDGVVHGAIFLAHERPAQFGKEAEDVLTALAAQTASAIENANLYRRARESEEQYRRLVTNVPDQIVTINAAGDILAMNRSVRGGSVAELLGKNIWSFPALIDRDLVRARLDEVIRSQQPKEFEARAVYDGEEHWFHVRAAPMVHGAETGAILISTDVTQRKRTEAEVNRMRLQLIQGEKLSALGSLVSGVAHELRTPLTYLSNNAFLLRRALEQASRRGLTAQEASQELAPFFTELTSGVDRINQLVEDLRRYTKARSDSDFGRGPLHEMVVDSIEIFRATNRRSHVVETSLSATPPIRANRGAIQQLTLNLLLNASEASESGGRIRVTTRAEDGGALLEVADEGAGIPPEVLARMYEPLYTTKPGGTGLGLSIVKRIVEEHHAAIECESAPGRGTVFRVRFPAG